MPVPDTFTLAPDFGQCGICRKNYTDDEFVHIKVVNDRNNKAVRFYEICRNCREKCRTDPQYEAYVTDKVFNLSLGLRFKGEVTV